MLQDEGIRFKIQFSTALLLVFTLLVILLFTGCKKKSDKVIFPEEVQIVSTYPLDGGRIRDLEHPLYIKFSDRVDPKDLTFSVNPDPGGWSVTWQGRGKRAVLSHAKPFSGGVEYVMSISLEQGGRKKSVRFTAYGPTSIELINKDEENKILDLDTAWTYRMQTLFEPGLLPLKYRSSTLLIDGDSIMCEFVLIQEQLKDETRKKLRPYTVRPTEPESIFYQARVNGKKTTENKGFAFGPRALYAEFDDSQRPGYPGPPEKCKKGPINVWAPMAYSRKAIEVCQYIDNEDMYNKFSTLLGRSVLV